MNLKIKKMITIININLNIQAKMILKENKSQIQHEDEIIIKKK